ncbi:PaaX family transcriptional regulator C-terminal domain-containing protein [Pseudorhodoplanes sp.]|uniref:PaaX family transcriptional regulator C-terminal domain-containing protein n=1 Tax=Pseudorhodoplanes sp. TaxID=1934341 RepID=UPI003D0FC313
MTTKEPIASLLKKFHARKPARIWSLIVTLYGDAIVPRGGSLWIGSLIEIMDLFQVDAGHVRTAVSRLTSDGWLASTKRGRASYYRLTRSGEAEFMQATQRIYSSVPVVRGDMQVIVTGPGAGTPSSLRAALKAAGYAAASPVIHVGFGVPASDLTGRDGLFVMTPRPEDRRKLAAMAFRPDEVSQAYRDFVTVFSPLADAMVSRPPADAEALVARTLLIHAFRRAVLRDPGLPADLLPSDWPGEAARALAGRIYSLVVNPSERFLDRNAQNEDGPLPAPVASFRTRFSK